MARMKYLGISYLATLALMLVMMTPVLGGEDNLGPLLSRDRRQKDNIMLIKQPLHLRVATLPFKPYMMYEKQKDGTLKNARGFLVDLLEEMRIRSKFSYTLYEVPDLKYGSCDAKGCTGLLQELKLRENSSTVGADMAAAPLTMNPARNKVVDFVHPFHNMGLTVLVKRALSVEKYVESVFDFTVLSPLDNGVWGMCTLICIVCGLFLWAMNHFNPYEWGGRYNLGLADEHQKNSFTLAGSLWFAFTALQWQGFERAPRSIASKVLTIFYFAFVTMTLVTYTGGLVTHLWWRSLVHKSDPTVHPIRSLEHLIQSPNYRYGAVRDSSTYKYITGSGSLVKAEYAFMAQYWNTNQGKNELVDSVQEGVDRVRNASDKHRYALILDTMTGRMYSNEKPCDVVVVGPEFAKRSYGLAIPKNSPHKELFDHLILSMIEDGTLELLEHRWWEGTSQCWDKNIMETAISQASQIMLNKPATISLHMFWGPLVMMACGMVFAFFVGIGEMLYYKHKGRYKATNRPQGQTLKLENDEGGPI